MCAPLQRISPTSLPLRYLVGLTNPPLRGFAGPGGGAGPTTKQSGVNPLSPVVTATLKPGEQLRQGNDRNTLLDIFAFLVPATLFLEIELVGRLFISEILLLAGLPVILFATRGRSAGARPPRWIFVLGFLWLISQILTDVVRRTPWVDYSRGWAKIAFTMVNCAALFPILINSSKRIKLFALGYIIGSTISYVVHPSPFAQGNPWEFGLATPVTLAIVLLTCRNRWRFVTRQREAQVALLGAAALNLELGYRSLAGFCFTTFVYLIAQGRFAHRQRPTSFKPVRVVLITALGVSAVLGFARTYEFAASSGRLGDNQRLKYRMQSGSLGILIGGRSEVIASLAAIRDSPMIGHGSWARDRRYRLLLDKRLRSLGYHSLSTKSDLIPTHSYLFGGWVEAGLLGGIFWLAILRLPFRALVRLHNKSDSLTPLICLSAVSLIWSILFSPYGAEGRLLAPFYLATVLFGIQKHPLTFLGVAGPNP